jgi:hypothetical protein
LSSDPAERTVVPAFRTPGDHRSEALAEPDLDAAVRQLVRLLLKHAGGRLADDVLLVLSEPVGARDVLSSPL